MNIIENLKNKWNQQAWKIYDYIIGNKKVSEEILLQIYFDFETSIENIKKKQILSDLHQFDNVIGYMKKMKIMEEKEREEENPDDILKQI